MATTRDTPKTLSELLDPCTTMMVGITSTVSLFDSRPLTVADVSDAIRVLVHGSADWASQVTSDEYAHDRDGGHISPRLRCINICLI